MNYRPPWFHHERREEESKGFFTPWFFPGFCFPPRKNNPAANRRTFRAFPPCRDITTSTLSGLLSVLREAELLSATLTGLIFTSLHQVLLCRHQSSLRFDLRSFRPIPVPAPAPAHQTRKIAGYTRRRSEHRSSKTRSNNTGRRCRSQCRIARPRVPARVQSGRVAGCTCRQWVRRSSS